MKCNQAIGWTTGKIALTLSIAVLISCKLQGPTTVGLNSSAGKKALAVDAPILDVFVQSPIAVVQHKNGSTEVFVPRARGHQFSYVKGIGDCPIDFQKNATDYDISANVQPGASTNTKAIDDLDPQGLVHIDRSEVNSPVDSVKRRAMKFKLPNWPYEIVSGHTDPAFISKQPVSTHPSSYPFYPTIMVIRYHLATTPTITVAGDKACRKTTSGPVAVDPLGLGNEYIVTIGVGPEIEDDAQHSHASNAFDSLLSLFPPLKRYVKFPDPGDQSELMPTMVSHGSDCRAPMMLITNVD